MLKLRLAVRCLALLTALAAADGWAHDATARADRETGHDDTREPRDSSEGRREPSARDPRESPREQPDAEKSGDARAASSDNGGSDDASRKGSSKNGSSEDRDAAALGRDNAMRAIEQRIDVERDFRGHERRSGEALMIGRPEAVAAVRAAGYVIIDQHPLASLRETIARVRSAPGESVEATVSRVQAIAPDASVAPDHIYRPSQAAALPAPGLPAAAVSHAATTLLGVIDAGADSAWSPLSQAIVRTRGFAAGGYVPRAHGTVVAEIAARGGARLAVADVFGLDGENRLAAPAEAIADAIDWLVVDQVRVINISIEGPDNVVLARVIRSAVADNLAIVAAAGNGGPAAPPAYPAAYPGVIAVTAIDEQGQVYRRANRGDYVAFAARGVHVVSGYGPEGPRTLSGTSFAAPVVAAAVARKLEAMSNPDVLKALEALRREAIDRGAAGKDPVYGWGEIR